jgi:hypothetical protein
MKRLGFAVVALLGAVMGCAEMPPEGERLLFREDRFSIDAIDASWSVGRSLGSVELGRGKTTIVVRAVPVAFNSITNRAPSETFLATRQVLDSLPEARVTGPQKVQVNGFAAAAEFDLLFKPPLGGGATYERRHLVLFGTSRLFHVVHTAPEGTLRDSLPELNALVASLREEVLQ